MANDSWRTPPEVFEYFNSIYDFKIDVCASKDNALCRDYIDEEEDALTTDWNSKPITRCAGQNCWLNPPYSNVRPFVQKAIDRREGANKVLGFTERHGDIA